MKKVVSFFLIILFPMYCYAQDHSSNVAQTRSISKDRYSYEIPPEIKEKLIERIQSQKLQDKSEIKKAVQKAASILAAKNRFSVRKIIDPCLEDIDTYCNETSNGHVLVNCLKKNRTAVTKQCEDALKVEFGSKPTEKETVHKGVSIPKGSVFLYDLNGKTIIGANVPQNIKFKNILFQKGQLRFNTNGLSYAKLAEDQYIEGIKYRASNTGPFFHENGKVENAILAEDTKVEKYIYKIDTQILFYPNGKVQQGTLTQKTIIQEQEYDGGTTIWFNQDGTISNN